jgi:hypothetical protein
MSGEQDPNDSTDVSRRTFMRASGAAAAAGVIGAGATGTAAAGHQIDPVFRNIRVREARKAWERGYRGRADRSLALTDTGAEGRHPDLGPWNDVTAATTENGLELYDTEIERTPVYPGDARGQQSYTGTAAGAEALGLRPLVHGPFSIPVEAFETGDDGKARIRTVITWEPENPEGVEAAEFELRLMKNGTQIATTGFQSVLDEEPQKARKELLVNDGVELNADDDYEFWVYGWRAPAVYEIDAKIEEVDTDAEPVRYEADAVTGEPMSGADLDGKLPDADDEPGLIAWHNDDTRYGDYNQPRDANGHGTHVSGIMTGSGQAATVEDATTDSPNTVLIAGDVLSYEVDASAEGGVFGAATGEGIEVVIEGPNGRQLSRSVGAQGTSEVSVEANITQTPAVHDSGAETYTVYVRTTDGEFAAPGRVKEVAAGSFADYGSTSGEALADDDYAIHAGIAPGNSLVAVTGLGGGANNVGRAAEDFAAKLGVRAVNMSWGAVGGIPIGIAGGALDTTPGDVADITDGGILTVAAAGNAATPANGNSSPAVVEEAISVVATGPRDGIAAYSSGGLGGVNEEGQPHAKPDVTAPGGLVNQLDWAAKAGDPDSDEAYGDVRDFTGKGGTSMASPSVCGTAGLLAQAMEEDAPDALSLPEPAETTREDVMKLKSVLLSTASTTAFTAAPYHRAKSPVYTFGERDPYEGYGRVNVDAAIDAVTRELLDASGLGDNESASAAVRDTVGLDVPDDSRAVAGYVTARGGTLDVSVDFANYSGGNCGMAEADPHIDLFVYETEPATNGEPNVAASAQGEDGSAGLSLAVDTADAGEDPNEETFFVVAELVNVPGAVNGYDVQASVDVEVSFDAGEVPDVTTEFSASGSRSDDGAVFTGGQTNQVKVTIEEFEHAEEIAVTDTIPPNWDVDEEYGDVASYDDGTVTFEGTVTADQVAGDSAVTFEYFAEAPDGAAQTGAYGFGPAEATVVTPAVPGEDTDGELDGDQVDDFGGTDTNIVAGADTS